MQTHLKFSLLDPDRVSRLDLDHHQTFLVWMPRTELSSSIFFVFFFTIFSLVASFRGAASRAAFPRSTMAAAAAASGAEMLGMQSWAVVGDALNEKKPAFAIAEKLRGAGKDVVVVNPREKEARCATALGDVPGAIDVVDLVISPKIGPQIVDDMAALDIKNVFIQPGAGSDEIMQKCASAGISVHQGCVLVEL